MKGARNTWTLYAKVQILSKIKNGSTAADAISLVAEEVGIDISNTPSYKDKAGTHTGRFRQEIIKRLARGDQEAIRVCEEFNISIEQVAKEQV